MLPKRSKSLFVKIHPEFNFKMNFDGCSKGNPGLGGAGAVIYNKNKEISCNYCFVGDNVTNNCAEYSGLILGLKMAIEMDIKILLVEGDSQLVINQMTGRYKCKSSCLMPFYVEAQNLKKQFHNIKFKHILRDVNTRADKLSNIAVEEYLENIE
jgi:ribonuclease HI